MYFYEEYKEGYRISVETKNVMDNIGLFLIEKLEILQLKLVMQN